MEPMRHSPEEAHGSSSLGSSSFWYPPGDPDKPRLPYLPGFSIQICRHTPPPAYSSAQELEELGHQERPQLGEEYLYTVTQSEAVTVNPPVKGVTPTQVETAQLTVTSPISIGAVRGAQVVSCLVTPQDGDSFSACAKIYDPLYYDFKTSTGHSPRDCVLEADEDYIVETWAYNFLQQTGQASRDLLAPEYHGSWTFRLPITLKGIPMERPIRLILMEHLHGTSIEGSRVQNNPIRGALPDSFHYPEGYRLDVLARAMEGYVKQKKVGLTQNDFSGRNIILVVNESTPRLEGGDFLPRIVLIDYNRASMRRKSKSLDDDDPRPTNPALEFWGNYLFEDIAGWVPGTWRDVKIQQQWLLQRFCAQGQRESYQPVPEWLLEQFAQRLG